MHHPRPVIVAVDGPAGAGKSTVARILAERLGYTLVDTGAIYRTLGLLALRRGVDLADGPALAALGDDLDLRFSLVGEVNRVSLSDEDVTEAIRTPEASLGASSVSARPEVRDRLLDLQRRLALESGAPGAVLEGRDIGTVVFPDADHKFFVTATPEVRARRRFDELTAKGAEVTFERVLEEQEERDLRDRTREVAPLEPAADALVVDTSGLTVEQVVSRLADVVLRG